MKFKTFIAIALVVMLSLVAAPVISAQEVVPSSTDDTAGVFLFSAGLSAGTADAPTGQPAGAPTDDIITAAISFDLLEFVGDVPEEVDSWSYGAVEGQTGYGQVDTTLAEVIEGLTTVDDFGYMTEGGDDAANFDAGTGGCFVGGLRAIPSVRDALVIVPDGVPATGTMGPSGAGDAGAAELALDGCEIFIFDDGELSGMEIVLSSPGNNIVIGIGDRQINPNTAAGADDTLIAIDLDTLDGFDGTFIDTISICDDGVVMTASPPIFGDTSLEIDAIAVRSLASETYGGCTPGFWKNHLLAWGGTGYSPADEFKTVFGLDIPGNKDLNKSLLRALQLGGGKYKALMRHAVAALLNAASPDVNYLYSEDEIIALVQDAFATGDYETAKDLLEAQNELGCPL